MSGKAFRKAFLHTVPVMTGYLVLGMGFGILLKNAGYGAGWALAMSGLIYAGSMQYLGIGLITGGASLFTVALTTLMVNARHLFYGISMVDRYRNTGRQKPYLIFALTDETYSLVCARESVDKGYYLTVSALDHLYWVTGSLLGSLVGDIIPFPTEGIDFALTALFLTVFTDQWLKNKDHVPALTGVGASVLCLVLFGTERFLIPAMAAITALLVGMRGLKGAKKG